MSTVSSHFGADESYEADHEFSADENKHIDTIRLILLEISLLMFGIGALLLAMAYLVPGLAGWVTSGAGGMFLVLGVVYYHPLAGFKRVTTTTKDDINQMMVAIDNLGTAFRTGAVIVTILSALMLALIILLLT
jgi:uncharacterized membrane protein